MRSGSELLSEKMQSRCAFSQWRTDSQKLPASHRHPNALFTLCLLGIWIAALFSPSPWPAAVCLFFSSRYQRVGGRFSCAQAVFPGGMPKQQGLPCIAAGCEGTQGSSMPLFPWGLILSQLTEPFCRDETDANRLSPQNPVVPLPLQLYFRTLCLAGSEAWLTPG